jgi:hypothetical protein
MKAYGVTFSATLIIPHFCGKNSRFAFLAVKVFEKGSK